MLFDFADTSNQNVYKLLVATIGPRPIAWVTTKDVDGTLNAAPFSFFNAMSGNPPVLAFGIGGLGAAVLGNVADHTGIAFVYQLCAYLPAIGLLAVFLPKMPRTLH